MKLPRLLLSFLMISPLAFAAGEKIAVIPKGTTHSFWKSVEAGARKAGDELGAEIIWKGPLKEDDRAQQIAVVQQFVASGVSAIVLAPLDDTALRTPVKSAAEHNIPVVIFDSALKGEAGKDFISFGATISTAQDASMNLIDKVREADGIFCPNESTTQGMLLALRQTGLAGSKTFVGFDTSSFLLAALNKGEIQGLVAQNPTRMGYLAVTTVVKHLRGEKVEPAIDTGCVLVTKANRHMAEVEAVVGK